MNFRTIYSFEQGTNTEGAVYFIQLIDEMLFEYTMDTYKPSLHNATSVCRECKDVLSLVQDGAIDKHHFSEVCNELIDVLRNDSVAASLSKIDMAEFLSGISACRHEEVVARIDLIAQIVETPSYILRASEKICSLVIDGRNKKEIRNVSRSWLTAMISIGYTRRYIRDVLNEYFFKPVQNRDRAELVIKRFFEEFSLKFNDYQSTIRVSKDFGHITNSCADMGVIIGSAPPREDPAFLAKNIGGGEEWLYATFEQKALDVYGAAKILRTHIEKIGDIYSLMHHKHPLIWSDNVVVVSKSDSFARCIRLPVSAMKRVIDKVPKKAARAMHELINSFRLSGDSFSQFDRLVSLHAAAVRSDTSAAQLLNVWVALESLVPPMIKGGKVKSVIEALMPSLITTYTWNIFSDLLSDIRRFDSKCVKLLKSVDRKLPLQMVLANVMIDPALQEKRDQLYSRVASFVLLRNRVYAVADRFRNKDQLVRVIRMYRQRVEWQIRRIYRTRNMYVHSGVIGKHVDYLVENGHGYLDCHLQGVIRATGSGLPITTLDQAHVVAVEREKKWMDLLSSKSAVPNISPANWIFPDDDFSAG